MTKPASLLHCYWDSIDRIFQESCLKLQNLFGGNGEWIAGQRAKVKEERLKAAAATEQESLAAKKAKTVKKEGTVKKPRGRPPKKLDQTSAAMILKSMAGSTSSCPSPKPVAKAEENVKPAEENVNTAVEVKAEQPKPKKRGRPKKVVPTEPAPSELLFLGDLKSALSVSGESLEAEPESVNSSPIKKVAEKPKERVGSPALPIEVPLPEPELKYILAQPLPPSFEKTLAAAVQSPLRKVLRTPAKEQVQPIELEIVNSPESARKPRLSQARPVRLSQAQPPRSAKRNAIRAMSEAPSVPPSAKKDTPKVESWTSQFLKIGPAAVPVETERPKPVVEIAPAHKAEVRPAVAQPLPSSPLVAPAEVKPAAPPAKVHPALANVMAESASAAVESPLTRARRIDSQNTWREQQLSKFFVSKTEVLKSAMDTLKTVKNEERASKIMASKPIFDETSGRSTAVSEKAPVEAKTESAKNEERTSKIVAQEATRKSAVAEKPPVEVPIVKPVERRVTQASEPPLSVDSMLEAEINAPPAVDNDSLALDSIFSPKKRTSPRKKDFESRMSPFKHVMDSSVFDSGPASPNFLTSVETPQLDNTELPDEIIKDNSSKIDDSDVFEMKIPAKRDASSGTNLGMSEEERLKRQRLKERQQQAIEKRNLQIKKAQESKAKQEELFNAKAKPLTLNKPVVKPSSTSSIRPNTGSTMSALNKTAIFNASKSNIGGTTSEKTEFKTPAAKIKSPAPIKMAEKIVSSPLLPEIPSDEEDYLKRVSEGRVERPDWAVTPALKAALFEQQGLPTDKIFDKIQPVRLEEIFKNKSFKRGRNSTIPFM